MPWRSPPASATIDGMNSARDIDEPVSDERDPDAPATVDEERIVDDTEPDDVGNDVPVPLDAGIEVPTADAIDQHRHVTLDDDEHDQV